MLLPLTRVLMSLITSMMRFTRFFILSIVMSVAFSSCFKRATENQCIKACYNIVSLKQKAHPDKVNWDAKIADLKKEKQQVIERLMKNEASIEASLQGTLNQIEEELKAHALTKPQRAMYEKQKAKVANELKDVRDKYEKRKKSIVLKFDKKIHKVMEEKLQYELEKKKAVDHQIKTCVGNCKTQKWTEKKALCIIRLKDINELKNCE